MNRWRVALVGEAFDLEELPKLFETEDARVIEEDGTYFLESSTFEPLKQAQLEGPNE